MEAGEHPNGTMMHHPNGSIPHDRVWLNEWLNFEHRVSIVVVYDIICAFGVFSNGLPILLTFLTKLGENNVNLLVANMSSADMINCLVIFAQNVYILHRENLPAIGCTILGYCQFVMDIQVFIFPPILSLNRYISLFHNHKYDRMFTPAKIYCMIGFSWLLCSAVPMIFVLGGKAKYDEDNEHCCVVTKGDLGWSVFYWVLIIVPLVGICNGTVLFCNVKIFQRLRDHSAIQTLHVNVVTQNREMLVYLVVEMLLPMSAHTIYHIIKFAYFDREIVFFRGFFAALVFFNSEMRGVMTMTLLGPYRKQGKEMLKMCGCWRGNRTSKVGPTPARTTFGGNTHSTGKSGGQQGRTDRNRPIVPVVKTEG